MGVFVEVAGKRGWKAEGLEPSHWAVAEGRSRGLTMHQGTLRDAELDAESYDAVTMWDVVEHLIDPMSDLVESARLLKPGGEMYFSDVYADRRVPSAVAEHPVLYSECLGGALYWNDLIRASGRGYNPLFQFVTDGHCRCLLTTPLQGAYPTGGR